MQSNDGPNTSKDEKRDPRQDTLNTSGTFVEDDWSLADHNKTDLWTIVEDI